MSQENVEVVRTMWDAFLRRDFDRALSGFHPDVSERDPRERVTITAKTTRVAPGHWIARERPELFKPVDRRDGRTYRAHSDNLERARRDLERGGTATRRVSDQRRAGVLPTPRPVVGLRWPRSRRPALVLP